MEIFSTYGKIKMIDMPVDRLNPHLSKGYAYVEFENPDEAEKALKHMDGGICQNYRAEFSSQSIPFLLY